LGVPFLLSPSLLWGRLSKKGGLFVAIFSAANQRQGRVFAEFIQSLPKESLAQASSGTNLFITIVVNYLLGLNLKWKINSE
jgi:hypothetical protein